MATDSVMNISGLSPELVKFRSMATALPLRRDRADIMNRCIQHGDTSCLRHSVAVAYFSLLVADALRLRLDRESLVRGALLHDYFLYDWHQKDVAHRLHGFHHPKRALENASRDFDLNPVEKDIILHHMFPLVPVPPKYPESFIVSMVDKGCSIYEIFARRCYFWFRYAKC